MSTFSTRKFPTVGLLLLFTSGLPLSCVACEPVLPLFQLLAGTSLLGTAALTQSLLWLLVAVTVKCGAFVILERRLTWGRAVFFMIVANVISTFPGSLLAVLTGSATPIGLILGLALVFVLGWIVERRVAHLPQGIRPLWLSTGVAMLLFSGFFIISAVLYGVAASVLDQRSYTTYWLFKYLFVTLVACTGIVISAVLEECVIARLARKSHPIDSFFTPVFRANYVTLGVILLVAALKMMPKRLQSPHFITSWLDSLLASIGLA